MPDKPPLDSPEPPDPSDLPPAAQWMMAQAAAAQNEPPQRAKAELSFTSLAQRRERVLGGLDQHAAVEPDEPAQGESEVDRERLPLPCGHGDRHVGGRSTPDISREVPGPPAVARRSFRAPPGGAHDGTPKRSRKAMSQRRHIGTTSRPSRFRNPISCTPHFSPGSFKRASG